jgi:hypothetical protein
MCVCVYVYRSYHRTQVLKKPSFRASDLFVCFSALFTLFHTCCCLLQVRLLFFSLCVCCECVSPPPPPPPLSFFSSSTSRACLLCVRVFMYLELSSLFFFSFFFPFSLERVTDHHPTIAPAPEEVPVAVCVCVLCVV